MPKIDRFPGIRRALMEIEYDNGGINRFWTEENACEEADEVLSSCDDSDLREIDAWLGTLTQEELELICAGEESEADELLRKYHAPQKTKGLLNDLFDSPEAA